MPVSDRENLELLERMMRDRMEEASQATIDAMRRAGGRAEELAADCTASMLANMFVLTLPTAEGAQVKPLPIDQTEVVVNSKGAFGGLRSSEH